MRAASLAALLLLTSVTAAHAEYRLKLVEIDDDGTETRSAWTCPERNDCRHDFELTLNGRRQPVEARLRDEQGTVHLRLVANGFLLALIRAGRRPEGLSFEKGEGVAAGSYEIWATQYRDNNGTSDLVFRTSRRLPVTIGLIVEHSTALNETPNFIEH